MWQIELKPEIKKELKNPEKYVKGMQFTYSGITITMVGVGMMFILYFIKPEHVLRPFWIQILGLVVAGWGEWLKFRGK
ncbi:MAG: hypothetical protein QGG38_01420 [Nitrospinaceae bacterium]|jgi:hypothetical protein|nr:hypothetical protein [Nitrospinaceae bacterium]MDP6657443.1 hypothetical protein [Nitrospinaceae bacterium]MDP6711333.1 hypothetical protein [Nitrospinaceae bacterium]MDP7057509.1 hypothetical protein [Nitrospinaceae bacterium]HAK37728.1 hypothetical protein [Nitrospina sp.]|tara:strand:+ start:11877 stop:12110 length:234 start_codon:yes stop_codon:yes gene_type:complete